MMERSFAGFWRDGAVVKPSDKHYDNDRCVFAVHKKDGSLDICLETYEHWDKVYWLDTTTPTELTPQQAFELYRVIYPQATSIDKTSDGWSLICGPSRVEINWGSTTEYPPQQKWRVPTDADKGKRCRYRDNDKAVWIAREDVSFMCTWNDSFWVVYGKEVPCLWKFCEVLE
jgi:hypothetical protein